MEWAKLILSFIVDLMAEIAWPVVIIVAMLVFREQLIAVTKQLIHVIDQLAKRIEDLIRIKGPAGVSVDFKKTIDTLPPLETKEKTSPEDRSGLRDRKDTG